MIYGAIEEKSGFHTDMKNIFEAIHQAQKNYNWLIAYPEVWTTEKNIFEEAREFYFLTGEELTRIVNEDRSQWVWGVLSGFDKRIPKEDVLKYPLVDANGYTGFWQNPLTLCHPLAELEIVAWDGCLTLVLSDHKKIVEDFRRAYPQAEDLYQYNLSMPNKIS